LTSITPRQEREGGGDDPGILAGSSGRQQHAEIAEFIRRLCDLGEIAQRDLAGAKRRAEIAAIAMGRQEPQDICGFVARSIADLGHGRLSSVRRLERLSRGG